VYPARVNEGASDEENLSRLRRVLARSAAGPGHLSDEELMLLPQLYRHASSLLARLETTGHDGELQAEVRKQVLRAHGLLYRGTREGAGHPLQRAVRFLMIDSPRAIRAEARLLGALLLLFYGLAALSYGAVDRDLELAFALFSPEMVESEVQQLRETPEGEPFRGNFTFGIGESPQTAGWILAHNISISMVFFGAGLFPPLFLWMLVNNALMVGTYTGVAAHWGQAGAISSILWCHGVIELQMIVLAGTAGLVLVRAWVAPGPWSRRHAMVLESRRAWALMAPVFPFLTLSGLIEGYVSPHAPPPVRLAVAAGSALLLAAWLVNGCREPVRRLTPLSRIPPSSEERSGPSHRNPR